MKRLSIWNEFNTIGLVALSISLMTIFDAEHPPAAGAALAFAAYEFEPLDWMGLYSSCSALWL